MSLAGVDRRHASKRDKALATLRDTLIELARLRPDDPPAEPDEPRAIGHMRKQGGRWVQLTERQAQRSSDALLTEHLVWALECLGATNRAYADSDETAAAFARSWLRADATLLMDEYSLSTLEQPAIRQVIANLTAWLHLLEERDGIVLPDDVAQ